MGRLDTRPRFLKMRPLLFTLSVEIDAQPPTCAAVGVSNADSNQARTAGENGASGSP